MVIWILHYEFLDIVWTQVEVYFLIPPLLFSICLFAMPIGHIAGILEDLVDSTSSRSLCISIFIHSSSFVQSSCHPHCSQSRIPWMNQASRAWLSFREATISCRLDLSFICSFFFTACWFVHKSSWWSSFFDFVQDGCCFSPLHLEEGCWEQKSSIWTNWNYSLPSVSIILISVLFCFIDRN